LASGALALISLPSRAIGKLGARVATDVEAVISRSSSSTYLEAKLGLDNLISPTPAAVSRDIAIFVDAVRQIAGRNPTVRYKVAAIRKVIYEGGPWNGNRPFGYDLADPFGLRVENKLLSTYMRTRLGNCVSMPALFMILAEQVELEASFVPAPLHVFVRFTHPERGPTNVETTSGARFARDEWYRGKMRMTDRAIESGIYMRALTKAEGVALLATTVLEYLERERRYQDVVDVADVILRANPRDAHTMVKRGTAFGHLMQSEFLNRFPSPASIPPALQRRYRMLAASNRQAFEDAERLGWEPCGQGN
jgi:regulator of sirC expression with transglutaminase-like and TPR domain